MNLHSTPILVGSYPLILRVQVNRTLGEVPALMPQKWSGSPSGHLALS